MSNAPSILLRNFIGGRWTDGDGSAVLPVTNPSLGAVMAQVPLSTKAAADSAVEAAQAAFGAWSRTPVSQRVSYLYYARKFKLEAEVGMIGVNVGIPAPVASLPFGGMRSSLFADVKAQGRTFVDFFTERKTITQRFWQEP